MAQVYRGIYMEDKDVAIKIMTPSPVGEEQPMRAFDDAEVGVQCDCATRLARARYTLWGAVGALTPVETTPRAQPLPCSVSDLWVVT